MNTDDLGVEPDRCIDMREVREGVDAVDRALIALVDRRFGYMEAAARIKPDRAAVRDEARKAQVIDNVKKLAGEAGIPVPLVAAMWEMLVEGSIAYEMVKFCEIDDRP
ncbi:MAG: chorismate mutase [Sphingomonadaceae bacterium]|nr:chorismate mutase [Sphingomonadaceae bacterium]